MGSQVITANQISFNVKMEQECLIFQVNDMRFGVELDSVQEITRVAEIVRVRQSCDYMIGFFDLRGYTVPLIDPRPIFGHPAIALDEIGVILVINVNNELMGLAVDSIGPTCQIDMNTLRPASAARQPGIVKGMVFSELGHTTVFNSGFLIQALKSNPTVKVGLN